MKKNNTLLPFSRFCKRLGAGVSVFGHACLFAFFFWAASVASEVIESPIVESELIHLHALALQSLPTPSVSEESVEEALPIEETIEVEEKKDRPALQEEKVIEKKIQEEEKKELVEKKEKKQQKKKTEKKEPKPSQEQDIKADTTRDSLVAPSDAVLAQNSKAAQVAQQNVESYLLALLQKHIKYPTDAIRRGYVGKAELEVLIGSDGSLLYLRLHNISLEDKRMKKAVESALRAVQHAWKKQPTTSELQFIVPFRFDLTKK